MSFDPTGNVFPADVIDTDDKRLPEARDYLAHRFFPPLPAAYAEPMLAAIDLLNSGDATVALILPHLNPMPRTAFRTDDDRPAITPGDLVDACRVWHLVTWDDES